MSEYDRQNLEFLMTLDTPQKWAQWAQAVDYDDLCYAETLLQVARLEVIDKIVENHSDLGEAQMLVQYIKERI